MTITALNADPNHEQHYARCDSCTFFSSLSHAWNLSEVWEGKTTITLCAECEIAAEKMGVKFSVVL